MGSKSRQKLPACVLPFLCSAMIVAANADPWPEPDATLRAHIGITARPTHPEAGIVMIIPDGGALPTPNPTATIITRSGKRLRHAGLWHNPDHGLALVVEDTPEEVTVYLHAAPDPYPRAPLQLRDFKPSVLFYYTTGDPSLDTARELAFRPSVGTNLLFAHATEIYDTDPPAGRNGNGSSLYTGWFPTARDGACYFYSISKEGSVFYVDGDKIHSWAGVTGQRGGEAGDHGAWRNTAAGLHRVDYFHFNVDPRAIDHLDPGGREAHFGMRRPDPRIDAESPPASVPRDARPMRRNDYVQSGRAYVARLESREGPVAAFDPRGVAYAVAGTNTLYHYQFQPIGPDPALPGSAFTWKFPGEITLHGRHQSWVFCGRSDRRVTLQIASGSFTSSMTRVFFPKHLPNRRHDLAAPEGRDAMRLPLVAMMDAIRRDSPDDACSIFSSAFAESLFAVLDVGDDRILLERVVDLLPCGDCGASHARDLRELFIESLRPDAAAVQKQIEKFSSQCVMRPNESRAIEWMIHAAGIHVLDGRHLDDVRLLLDSLAEPGALDAAALLQLSLRRGDLAFLSGNLEGARVQYEQASRAANAIHHQGLAWNGRSMKEGLIRDSLTAQLEHGSTSAIYRLLRRWEREFPLAKLGTDWWYAYARYMLRIRRVDVSRRILVAAVAHDPGSADLKRLLSALSVE